ncbi:MAG: MFS transporter [Sediminibacterium sp. Gen4]|jgi:MFS transporter, putative metabolite:H+ symporter|uniref:MFS transporter n=1 Tax=unclassified Sediminibacterium TaxID=2635961 RepID=UPI0015B8FA5E|nr:MULTISPECIES: MFS transporter [unclassified Sediminibacterium]MBW0160462.1 MFS transporter [Sediminibacterium sp.]MBW0165429.1 MFS transporter [Sediminibacterium sp.]MDZ4070512.1 MFS transporter [Sediminibacterium sp.]NWK65372.1 MFS transporter [Sediminibacterium sp. Gen4]
MTEKKYGVLSLPVIVAALGYFVDIYDLLLFTIVKKPSMLGVGSTDATMLVDSTRVINWQMTGLLLGGIIWGMLADKKGRLSVLFGSIILYSIANFATGFVQTVDQYAACRFVGGLGLAGELGAGITLVSELLPKNKRGIGTSLVAGIGLSGAVAAYFTYQFTDDWRLCYKIGGGLGIALLLLRVSVAESGMFKEAKEQKVVRGNFFMLINNGKRLKKYIFAILIGLPTWYVIGILVNQSDRFGNTMFGSTTIDSGRSIMFAYAAIAIGDMLVGLVSQYFKSRKKALLIYYMLTIIGLILFFSGYNRSDSTMYAICTLLGFSTGFWAIFVTMGAEQFGTNLRGTAATTIPNMVRGALPLINMMFLDLFQKSWGWSLVYSGIITGIVVMTITLIAYYFTEETFHKDLNYVEE